MLTFRFAAANAVMTIQETLTSGMVGKSVNFEFASDWANLTKTIVYENGSIIRAVAYSEDGNTIPDEVLAASGNRLYVGAFGESEDGTLMIPTIFARGPYVQRGADPLQAPAGEPPLASYAKLMAMIGDMDNLKTDAKASLVAAVNELYGKIGTGTGSNNGSDSTQNPTGGTGWTAEQIDLLDQLFNHIPFKSDEGGDIADALIASLRSGSSGGEETPDEPENPEVTLSSISAAYSGGSVPAGTALTDLTGIVVTAYYSDGTSETVTGYTLSGTIAEGENTITVAYQGMTATFTVTGVVESEPEVVELPNGYTQLTYISNLKTADSTDASTASFDTGVVPTENTNAEYKVNFAKTDTYTSNILTADGFYFPYGNVHGWKADKLGTSNQNVYSLEIPVANTDYVVSAFGSGNQVIVNGVVGTVAIGTTATEDTLCLFGDVAKTNPALHHMKGRIYYCKIWEFDELIRHFIPCSNPDGVIGMYDVVNGVFYDSDTTAAFIGGEPV